jgi:hypothetical protein
VDPDEIDDAIAVELLNNQTDDDLSLEDAERQTTAGGCLSTATIVLAVVIVLTFSFR